MKTVKHKEINGKQYCIIAANGNLEAQNGKIIVLLVKTKFMTRLAFRVTRVKDYEDGGLPEAQAVDLMPGLTTPVAIVLTSLR